MFKLFFYLTFIILCSFLFSAQTVLGAALVIHSGAQLKLNSSTLNMNCQEITIEDGGTLDLGSGYVDECWDLTITGTGQLIGPPAAIEYCDSDTDGLENRLEEEMCTDYADADSDDDGIPDGTEDTNHNGIVDSGETHPCLVDSDGDDIQDGTEIGLLIDDTGPDTDLGVFIADADPSSTTDPLDTDSDNDGIPDGLEDKNYNGAVDTGETDPTKDDFPWEIFYPAFIKKAQQ